MNKSDYLTAHQAYTDMDGLSRNFTNIDYDRKSTIASGKISEEEVEEAKAELYSYREKLIERILNTHAVYHPETFADLILRDGSIRWDETMLRDPGMDITRLRNICIVMENRSNLM